jgi:hypothetical protein
MAEIKNIFFAYQGKSHESADAIKRACLEYNKYAHNYKAITWQELKQSTPIPTRILNAIDQAEVFAADLTYLNHNVLFELGYAIGKRKKLFIILNNTIENAENNYKKLRVIRKFPFIPFENFKQIHVGLQQKGDFESIVLDSLVNVKKIAHNVNDIFYIKGKLNNQESLELIDYLNGSDLKSINDNSLEIEYQTLTWYLESILQSNIIIVHLAGVDKIDYQFENAEKSFYAGLAKGLGKEVLLIAPEPYEAPIDYYEILVQYKDTEDCLNKTNDCLAALLKKVQPPRREPAPLQTKDLNFLKLALGTGIAEQENRESLINCFIETSIYDFILHNESTIILGRKGTGKSAICIKLEEDFSSSDTNCLIILKPESDELLRNVDLSSIFHSELSKYTFFHTVWKFIIYSKLLDFIYCKIKAKHEHPADIIETEIFSFREAHAPYFRLDFFGGIKELFEMATKEKLPINDPSILELMYKRYLGPLIKIIQKYFSESKYLKLIILADNLDTARKPTTDLNVQAEMIHNLMGFEKEIKKEIKAKDDKTISVKTVIFLRKDIFEYIAHHSTESDKLQLLTTEIDWREYPNLLQKLIEKRFCIILDLAQNCNLNTLIWGKYFDFGSKLNPFEYIRPFLIPRPRDTIYFFSKLFEDAINRDQDKVTNKNLEYAKTNYSKFLFYNLVNELNAEHPKIDKILDTIKQLDSPIVEYKRVLSIIIKQGYSSEEAHRLIEELFRNEYFIGVDKNGHNAFEDVNELNKKLKTKKWKIFPPDICLTPRPEYSGK